MILLKILESFHRDIHIASIETRESKDKKCILETYE
jgi:hypothetical protein